jgi:deoxyribonuclease IV
MLIPGIHASVSGGLDRALATVEREGLGCCQIFTSNQRQWKSRTIKEREKERYRSRKLPVVSHASYLINLASTDSGVLRNSREALQNELLRMAELNITWTVLHPGSHLGAGIDSGIRKIAGNVREILQSSPKITGILFENTAGQGTSVGSTFRQLKRILDGISIPERTGVCFDTCHAFAAGYDLSTPTAVDCTLDELNRIVDVSRVRAFHVNDSVGGLGSHLDRHASPGRGEIGLESLKYLVSMPVLPGNPAIVETPGTDADRADDARRLFRQDDDSQLSDI